MGLDGDCRDSGRARWVVAAADVGEGRGGRVGPPRNGGLVLASDKGVEEDASAEVPVESCFFPGDLEGDEEDVCWESLVGALPFRGRVVDAVNDRVARCEA